MISFENIQYFFTNFKSLLLQIKGCGIDKSMQEKQNIIAILLKFGQQYGVFVPTFNTMSIASGLA